MELIFLKLIWHLQNLWNVPEKEKVLHLLSLMLYASFLILHRMTSENIDLMKTLIRIRSAILY